MNKGLTGAGDDAIVTPAGVPMGRRILIVSDGKAGHENQARALCAALGAEPVVARVAYFTRLHKAMSFAADRLGLRWRSLYDVAPHAEGPFAAVIGAGSSTFYPARVLARKQRVPVCAVLLPRGYRLAGFTCVVAPAFDRPPVQTNVVSIPVNLTRTGAAFYAEGVAAFRLRHTARKPAVGVILGGPNRFATLRAEELQRQFERLFAATEGFERWVTTSRRTPHAVEDLVERTPFDFRLVYSREPFNPIPAFVSLCDTLFVTADSTGMLSEAVTHGTARVEVLMNLRRAPSKYRRLVQDLTETGAAHVFDGQIGDARRKIDLEPAFQRVAELLRLAP